MITLNFILNFKEKNLRCQSYTNIPVFLFLPLIWVFIILTILLYIECLDIDDTGSGQLWNVLQTNENNEKSPSDKRRVCNYVDHKILQLCFSCNDIYITTTIEVE